MRPLSKLTLLLVTLACCGGMGAQTRPRGLPPSKPPATTQPANDCLGYTQHPDLRPDNGDTRPVPTVSFRLEMATFDPKYFGVAVESSGRAAYVSEPAPPPEGTPGDPYIWKFVVSEPTRQRMFELAQQAGYFQGDFDYRKGNIANTGAKTLGYSDGQRCNQTTFNYSTNPAIAELTHIFQSISATMEFGRRLAFAHRFDRLGLDAELKNMEDAAKRDDLREVQAIEPVLKSIADDYAVMHVARGRAERLLARARANP